MLCTFFFIQKKTCSDTNHISLIPSLAFSVIMDSSLNSGLPLLTNNHLSNIKQARDVIHLPSKIFFAHFLFEIQQTITVYNSMVFFFSIRVGIQYYIRSVVQHSDQLVQYQVPRGPALLLLTACVRPRPVIRQLRVSA